MDPRLLEQLYCKYYPTALLYTVALCRNEELAKDITADAFLKALLSLPEDIPSFRCWLLRVCRNLWIDHLRKHSREISEADYSRLPDGDSLEGRDLRDQRSRCLWNAISALPSRDRELVTLHYLSGIPLKEIAETLGCSYSAVRQRMVRLRHTLKQTLEEQGYGYDI